MWEVCASEEMALWDEEGGGMLGGRLREKSGGGRFQEGEGCTDGFYNARTWVRVVVHGDDFTFSRMKCELDKMRAKMEAWWYDIKNSGMMGSGAG